MRRRTSAAVLGSLAVVLSAKGAAAGGMPSPPLKVELGSSVMTEEDGGARAATDLLIGFSLASAWPARIKFDLSAGAHCVFPFASAGDGTKLREAQPRPASIGGFIAFDWAVYDRGHVRAFIGARAEMLAADDVGVLGFASRSSIELWRPFLSRGIAGSLAISGWLELGVRERPTSGAAIVAASGLGLRLPIVALGM